jgi:ribonuclease HI
MSQTYIYTDGAAKGNPGKVGMVWKCEEYKTTEEVL